jgi:hypothetical protein
MPDAATLQGLALDLVYFALASGWLSLLVYGQRVRAADLRRAELRAGALRDARERKRREVQAMRQLRERS